MSSRPTVAFLVMAALPGTLPAAGRTLRIVDRVDPVCGSPGEGPAAVWVQVLDHEGRPLEGIAVRLIWRKRGPAAIAGVTNATGEARFSLSTEGEARITAYHVGFSTSVAERVRIRPGCLAAVTLPLQVEAPKEILTTAPESRLRALGVGDDH
jgi:carboxypeptidase family protein